MRLAVRNLLADPTRFLLSVAGVAVPVALILLLAGYRSGVYQQATAFNDPTLILADEPTANLDSKIGREISRLLLRIARGSDAQS